MLEEAGLIETRKGFEGNRPRTWATLTRKGRAQLRKELDAMRTLLRRMQS